MIEELLEQLNEILNTLKLKGYPVHDDSCGDAFYDQQLFIDRVYYDESTDRVKVYMEDYDNYEFKDEVETAWAHGWSFDHVLNMKERR